MLTKLTSYNVTIFLKHRITVRYWIASTIDRQIFRRVTSKLFLVNFFIRVSLILYSFVEISAIEPRNKIRVKIIKILK